MRLLPTTCALVALTHTALSLSPITRTGRYLYNPDGSRFYIKGISYQEQGKIAASNNPNAFPEPDDYVDPLALPNACKRDIPILQRLTVNTIRVYSVNSALNHDECMAAFDAAGIYTIIDLSLPVNGSLNRASPAWTTNLLNLYTGTIDAFSKYNNVLAFNIGNEVVTGTSETVAAPFIKAAARDIKAYLKSKKSKALVGFASTDGPDEWRDPLANYLACDSDETSLDLYGLNNYRWCGASSFDSAYTSVQASFANYPIPAYFAEYGCNTSPPRLWTEATALFSNQMAPVWSGGIAFSYFPALKDFGMVTISDDKTTVTVSDDFNRLQTVLSSIQFVNEPTQSKAGQSVYPKCPSPNASFLAANTLPPTPNQATCDCIAKNSFSCLFTPKTSAGLNGVGSLLDTGCQLLGQNGGSCDAIAGDGRNGKYGALSMCSPETKLSYVFSQYYERTNRNARSCNFAGNATVASPLPSNSAAAANAQQSCLSAHPTGVSTPTIDGKKSGALALRVGVVGVVVAGLMTGIWMLP